MKTDSDYHYGFLALAWASIAVTGALCYGFLRIFGM